MAPEKILAKCTLEEAAFRVLNTPSAHDKALMTEEIHSMWRTGVMTVTHDLDAPAPRQLERPARDARVKLVEPSCAPRLGKGGSPESRVAILHSLAHIESWAIDLSWDAIARFGRAEKMPRKFFEDFLAVAADEARHFSLLAARLVELGSSYGALTAHDGLWESATETRDSLEARLVIEHCVHEARGLDVLPGTIAKFRRFGDDPSADLLEHVIYPEEITHCAAGVRWFTYLQNRMGGALVVDDDEEEEELDDAARVAKRFHVIVRKHFKGILKPPFNDEARSRAGFQREWYEPLSVDDRAGAEKAGAKAGAGAVTESTTDGKGSETKVAGVGESIAKKIDEFRKPIARPRLDDAGTGMGGVGGSSWDGPGKVQRPGPGEGPQISEAQWRAYLGEFGDSFVPHSQVQPPRSPG